MPEIGCSTLQTVAKVGDMNEVKSKRFHIGKTVFKCFIVSPASNRLVPIQSTGAPLPSHIDQCRSLIG